MSRTQFINDHSDFLAESLEGFEQAHAELVRYHRDPAYVTRQTAASPDKVRLVSGGGSGHEPLHVGFVGAGMLDAAVPGLIFASPTPFQIAAASRAVAGEGGVVHIVKNYTGDVLNFGIAAELLAADGVRLETVLVDDDLATDDAADGVPGRRGTAAVVTVEKVCGAATDAGARIDEVAALGRRVNAASRTLSFAFTGATHPGESEPSFALPDGHVEVGVGIHGERGRSRDVAPPARELAAAIVAPLLESLGLRRGAEVIAIVNDLGASPTAETYLLYRELHRLLAKSGIIAVRRLVGSFVTALDMRGCSVTLTVADDALVRLWDAPVHTPALRW